MGMLWRMFAPRPMKKARRALRPDRVLLRAVTPKSIKTIRKATFSVIHPLEAAESAIISSIMRPHRNSVNDSQRSANGANTLRRTVFVYRCLSCGREFGHLSKSSRLRSHNDRKGKICNSQKGKLTQSIS